MCICMIRRLFDVHSKSLDSDNPGGGFKVDGRPIQSQWTIIDPSICKLRVYLRGVKAELGG